ncbi:MAG: hypothetical protein AB7S41_01855 [Parvibaculaceae bacterium]
MRIIRLAAIAAAVLALAGCSEESDKPYLAIAGGGFVYNYRVGDAFYGFVAKPQRALPEGSVLEAKFENPSGEPITETQKARQGQLQYTFQTPPLKGIRAGHPYTVSLRLLDPATGQAYATYEKAFHTDVDQSDLPDKPLVVGPGYAKNPEVDLK